MRNISLIIVMFLTAHALYTDIKRQEIEDYTWIAGAVFSIIITIAGYNDISIIDSLIGGILAFVFFFIAPMGGGDMKFMTFVGLFFGYKQLLIIIFFMCMFGAIAGICFGIKNKIKNPKLSILQAFKTPMPMMLGIAPAVVMMAYFSNIEIIQHYLTMMNFIFKY